MSLGIFLVVRVQQADEDYDVVLCEGFMPQGQVMPSNLVVYVKRPHGLTVGQKVELKGLPCTP